MPSEDGMAFGVVDVGSLRRRSDGDFVSSSRELVYDPASRPCRNPGMGQILTTIDASSAFALVGVRRGEVEAESIRRIFFISIFDTCSQEIVRCISLHHGGSLTFKEMCHLRRPAVT